MRLKYPPLLVGLDLSNVLIETYKLGHEVRLNVFQEAYALSKHGLSHEYNG